VGSRGWIGQQGFEQLADLTRARQVRRPGVLVDEQRLDGGVT